MSRALVSLFRPSLAILNGIAAVGGLLLSPASLAPARLVAVFAGVTLLAAAGSALNQLLERDLDRLMLRTRFRPLVTGALTPAGAGAAACACLLAGLLLLGAVGGMKPALLGAMAVGWYLSVYTPLKRRTSLALLAGAVCGAVPPLIGWYSAGGPPADYRVALFAGLLYLWQVPHFWLIQRRHQADYQRAGLPLFHLSPGGAESVNFLRLWLAALAAGSLLFPLFGILPHPLAVVVMTLPLAGGLIAVHHSAAAAFRSINLYPLLLTLLIMSQR